MSTQSRFEERFQNWRALDEARYAILSFVEEEKELSLLELREKVDSLAKHKGFSQLDAEGERIYGGAYNKAVNDILALLPQQS